MASEVFLFNLQREQTMIELYGSSPTSLDVLMAISNAKYLGQVIESQKLIIAAVERERSRWHRSLAFWLRIAHGRVE